MTGLIGALLALGVVLAIALGMGIRPRVRRLAQATAAWRSDADAGIARLRALRSARPRRDAP